MVIIKLNYLKNNKDKLNQIIKGKKINLTYKEKKSN